MYKTSIFYEDGVVWLYVYKNENRIHIGYYNIGTVAWRIKRAKKKAQKLIKVLQENL